LFAVEWQHKPGAVPDTLCKDLPRFPHG